MIYSPSDNHIDSSLTSPILLRKSVLGTHPGFSPWFQFMFSSFFPNSSLPCCLRSTNCSFSFRLPSQSNHAIMVILLSEDVVYPVPSSSFDFLAYWVACLWVCLVRFGINSYNIKISKVHLSLTLCYIK